MSSPFGPGLVFVSHIWNYAAQFRGAAQVAAQGGPVGLRIRSDARGGAIGVMLVIHSHADGLAAI